MSSRWIPPINWSKFPNEVKQRCKTIADEVAKLGWPPEVIEEKNGSYSFKAYIDGKIRTVAKLIPQPPYSDPVILAGFSPLLPGSESYAQEFQWRVEKCIFMHEPFFVSRITDDCCQDQIGEVFTTFLRQGRSQPGRPISL